MWRSMASVVVALSVPVAASGQELPVAEVLIEQLSAVLPAYWAVDSIRIVATSDLGDAVQPRSVLRFEAMARPESALFAETGAEGPFVLIVPTLPSEATRTLYGFIDLTYRAGAWSGDVTVENPVEALGRPLDMFDRPALQLGSDTAAVALAALRDQVLASNVAALERELAAKQTEQSNTLARIEIAQQTELVRISAESDARLRDFEAVATRQIADAEAAYRATLADLTTQNEPLVAEARAERERLLAAERELAAANMAELRAAQIAEIELLTSGHAAMRGELIVTQQQELAEIETRLATEQASLQRQLETANTVVELQTALVGVLAERQTSAALLLEAFDAERRSRLSLLSRLEGTWNGTVRCVETEGQQRVWDSVVRIYLEANSNGFAGEIQEEILSGGQDIHVVVMQESLSFPLELRAAIAGDGTRWANVKAIDLTIQPDGRVMGTGRTTWEVDNQPVDLLCSYQLSVNPSSD